MKKTIAICFLLCSVIGGAVAGPMSCDTSRCDRVNGGWICPKDACDKQR